MEHYVGLDVSLKTVAVCVVDQSGKIIREGSVPADPEAIAGFIALHAPQAVRIGLETGATSTWLWTELDKMGLPIICIDARHAKAALKMQINKSDRNDAAGMPMQYPDSAPQVSIRSAFSATGSALSIWRRRFVFCLNFVLAKRSG
jgi:Transposase